LVLRGLEAMLALLATLEEIPDAKIELRLIREIIRTELAGVEEREKLRFPGDNWIGAKICCYFLCSILQDRGAGSAQSVILLHSEAYRFVEGNLRRWGRGAVRAWQRRALLRRR
jgi:hypothetical protein